MKTLDKSLNMMCLANDFTIEKSETAQQAISYKIADKKSDLVAFYEDNEFKYYISGVYDSGSNYAKIDIKRLSALMEFCAYLQEFSK